MQLLTLGASDRVNKVVGLGDCSVCWRLDSGVQLLTLQSQVSLQDVEESRAPATFQGCDIPLYIGGSQTDGQLLLGHLGQPTGGLPLDRQVSRTTSAASSVEVLCVLCQLLSILTMLQGQPVADLLSSTFWAIAE